MTIIEASGHLYTWFSENDSFSIEKDFMKVIPITESPKRDRIAFKCALEGFEENDILKSGIDEDGVKHWILKKSFASFSQSVSLAPELALTISDVINKFREMLNMEDDYCDPTNIEEKDIANLIYITNILVSKKNNIDSNGELE
jgi:hypothetical protein